MTLENGEEAATPKVVINESGNADDGSDTEDERAVEVGTDLWDGFP